MRNIYFDTETRSLVDLRAAGGAVYAEQPSTSTLCAVWVENDQAYVWLRVIENTDKAEVARLADLENTFPWKRFQPPQELNYRIEKVHVHVGEELPKFYQSLLGDARWWAANGESFDKQVWKAVGVEPDHGIRNFTALSGSLQLPASVEGLGQLLFGIGKDPNGDKLIKSYCKEAAHAKSKPFHRLQTLSAYELAAYCARDVYILAAAGGVVLSQWYRFLADHEDAVLDVDSEIQERGFAVDKEFAGRFKNLSIKVQAENVEALAKKLTARFGKKGAVTPSDLLSTLKSPQKMKAYVKKLFGVGLSSLGRSYLNDLVDGSQKFISEPRDGDEEISLEDIDEFEEQASDDLESAEANEARLGDSFIDPLFLEILKTRMDIVRTTAAKLDAAVGRCTKDGRIHYSTRTGSTITLRWAGSGFQPQNLPKGDDRVDVDAWRKWILKGGEKPSLEPGVTFQEVLSTLVRTLIYAQNNDCLFALDLSGIEARVLLWLANDFGGLEEIVNGTDRYWEIAKKLFGLDPSTPSPKKLPDSDERKALFGVYRQLGKTMILGLGFGMGAVKFAENCVKEKIDLEALGTTADFAVNFWRDENTKIAGVRARDKHGNLKPLFNGHVVRDGGLHKSLEKAVVEALNDHNSSKEYPREVGRLKVYSEPGVVKGRDLFIELPSGRPLIYRNARMQPGRFDPEKDEFAFDTYQKDQVRTRFCHGSKFSQNATQATARDLLAQMLVEVQKIIKPMGGAVILSVHDEIVCEIPSVESEEALRQCAEAMTTRPTWAPDLPLGSEGAVFKTYRKTSQPGFPSCSAVDGKITKWSGWEAF
ncbi:MAG: hypothetical protein E6Q97_10545 [Desulfurellales bacterium]|nr:MAG: hypothetical protein E6Q97_10545 [Desulfurellales bacterium]